METHKYDAISKAYIPLRRKIFVLGPCVGLEPQRQNFALGIPTCWYLKTRKFVLPRTPNLKFGLPPTPNPKRKSVEYRLRWLQNTNFSRWPCTFLFCLCRFHSLWVPFFSEMWNLLLYWVSVLDIYRHNFLISNSISLPISMAYEK